MEDEDDLIPEPDSRGQLILSNRAWVRIDPAIWPLSLKIIKLDLSYNHLVELPSQIGELQLLRELILSYNKIASLPMEINKLKRLRKLILNNNRLRLLPPELGNLEMLEDLVVSENNLEELPQSLAKISNLKVIRAANNRLKSIPFELADVLTIEEFDCANNAHLDMIPAKWRGDTDSVLFTCRLNRSYILSMQELEDSNVELTKHTQYNEQDNLLLRERVIELQTYIAELEANMPKKIMKRLNEKKKLRENGEKERACVVC